MKQKGYELNDKDNKYCPKCDTVKPRDAKHFHKQSSRPDGLNAWCKECIRERNNSKKNRKYVKEWRKQNPDKVKVSNDKQKENRRQWREDNVEHIKEWKDKTRERRNAYQREYRKRRKEQDPAYKLRANMGSSICMALKRWNGSKGDTSYLEHLPYTMKELVEHLESQFDDTMTWENYGSYWHIDHVYPQSLLPYETMEEENFQRCWALENLQPLEAIENMKKSNKIL